MINVSVLTPTWNRAKYLESIWGSLQSQSVQCFEWIIVDDGSTDNTESVALDFCERSVFPVTYARFSKRVGKCRADNMLLNLACGEFVIWCDSDDSLAPQAIEKMLEAWDAIPKSDRTEYIGVIGICTDPHGGIQSTGGNNFTSFHSTWGDLKRAHGMQGDMCIMQRKDVIGNARFPEHDLVMNESGFWHQFMDKKVVCMPDVLKIMTRDTENRVSGSQKMEYCRGKAYSIGYADSDKYKDLAFREQLKLASRFHRYCIHGDLDFQKRAKLLKVRKNLAYFLGIIVGGVFAFKDVLQQRVIKTHIIFEQGIGSEAVVHRNQYAQQLMATDSKT